MPDSTLVILDELRKTLKWVFLIVGTTVFASMLLCEIQGAEKCLGMVVGTGRIV